MKKTEPNLKEEILEALKYNNRIAPLVEQYEKDPDSIKPKELAKIIRVALKTFIPSQKFSVKSGYATHEAYVDISYTNGVALKVVQKLAEIFEEIGRCQFTGEILSGTGNTYIQVHRELTDEALNLLIEIAKMQLPKNSPAVKITTQAYRISRKTSFIEKDGKIQIAVP